MSNFSIVAIYLGMIIFDFSVLAGTVFMIAEFGWSAWWILAAVLICGGSNPKNVILAASGEDA